MSKTTNGRQKLYKLSSRSHAVFMFQVTFEDKKTATISLVDLCGSEEAKNLTGTIRDESIQINLDLTELNRYLSGAYNNTLEPEL